MYFIRTSCLLQLMVESLKQKKHDINNIECLEMKLDDTNEGRVCKAVRNLNSEWAALDSKV